MLDFVVGPILSEPNRGLRGSLFVFCFLLVSPGWSLDVYGQTPDQPAPAYLPQIANGEFDGGRFRTTLVLTNTSMLPIEARIDLTQDDAGPLVVTLADGETDLGTDSSFTVVVPGGSTRFLETNGLGTGSVGAARIQTDRPLTVAALFSILNTDGTLVTETGVGDSQPLGSFVLPVDKTSSFNTGLALFNPDPAQPSELTLTLFNLTGQQQTSQVQVTLGALQHKAQYVDELFAGLGDFRGTLHVSADRPVAAMTLRQNFQPQGLTTLPVCSTASTQTQFNLPHVANGSFPGGRIRTSFLLFSLSAATASARLTLTRDDGTPLEIALGAQGSQSAFDLSIGPNGAVFLESGGTEMLASGAGLVVSDAPIGVAAIFSIADGDGRLVTEAGVAAAERLADLTVPVSTADSFDSGIALFNPRDSETTVTLALLDPEGTLAPGDASVRTLTLPPQGHAAQFVTELFPGTSKPFRGSVGMIASAEIAAMTLRQNSTPLAFTTLPVAHRAAKPIRGDGLVLNEVGFVPPAGQSPFLELKATQEAAWPAGLYLYNETGEEYRLPAALPPLAKGEVLLVVFDGQNRVEGLVVHADRTGFLNRSSGFVLLINASSQEIDHVGWGPGQAEAVPLGRGGVYLDPEEGMSIGRIPASERPIRVEDWISYVAAETTPGQPNRRPAVEMLLPFAGAVSEEDVIDLGWYPATGAVAYRVQVARDIQFTQIVTEQMVDNAEFRTPSLQPADYFWRVQSIFADQSEAGFSAPSVFSITAPATAGAVPAQVGENVQKKLAVRLISQRKDTRMLLLESNNPTGDHAWDKDHTELDIYDPADNVNCAQASIAMINNWFWTQLGFPNNRLSQDRIGYEVFKNRTPGPEWDLNYVTGLSARGQESEQTRALEWALTSRPTFKDYTTPDALWADVRREIDNDRPVLATVGGGALTAHTVVIVGYRIVPDGRRFVFVNNPWHNKNMKPVSLFHLDVAVVSPLLPSRVWLAYNVLSEHNVPRADEESVHNDTDRDGVYDFDEQERFKTNWARFPEDRDTDRDEVLDKQDIFRSVFDDSLYSYKNRDRRASQIQVPFLGGVQNPFPKEKFAVRPDVDGDGKPMELDVDSDDGGCYDGFEDFNFDGIQQNAESSNFEKWDDFCHVKGEEIRHEDFRTSETPSSRSDWQSDLTAKFCLGPLLPADRTNPQAVAGRATITWSAVGTTVYSQLTGSGCQMPLTVKQSYQTTFNPVDNSGSVGPGSSRGSITLAFYPRPNGVGVTPTYTESPPCEYLGDNPLPWPDSSAIWGGVGWFGPPFVTRLVVPPKGFKSPPTPFDVPQPGTGRSTLQIRFVTRTAQDLARPCQP